jgi:hypothetical protein
MIDQMVGADPLIGRATIAERLAISEDDLDQFLDHRARQDAPSICFHAGCIDSHKCESS